MYFISLFKPSSVVGLIVFHHSWLERPGFHPVWALSVFLGLLRINFIRTPTKQTAVWPWSWSRGTCLQRCAWPRSLLSHGAISELFPQQGSHSLPLLSSFLPATGRPSFSVQFSVSHSASFSTYRDDNFVLLQDSVVTFPYLWWTERGDGTQSLPLCCQSHFWWGLGVFTMTRLSFMCAAQLGVLCSVGNCDGSGVTL